MLSSVCWTGHLTSTDFALKIREWNFFRFPDLTLCVGGATLGDCKASEVFSAYVNAFNSGNLYFYMQDSLFTPIDSSSTFLRAGTGFHLTNLCKSILSSLRFHLKNCVD